jgi:hypothetical protein
MKEPLPEPASLHNRLVEAANTVNVTMHNKGELAC